MNPLGHYSMEYLPYNISLQRTFDTPRTFATAKVYVASNAAELKR